MQILKRAVVCSILALAPLLNANTYPADVPAPTYRNMSYGDHEKHVFDFWKADSNQPTGLIVVIHGGSWLFGYKEKDVNKYVDVAQALNAGISVAAINYRLINSHTEGIEPPVQAPLLDAARALQFMRSKADLLNIDKTKVVLNGGSAGGCTSLWLTYHDDLADPLSSDPVARESTKPFCTGLYQPQTSLDPQQMVDWTPNSTYGGHAFGLPKGDMAKFLAERTNILPWIQEYSPYEHVDGSDPEVAVFYPKDSPNIGADQPDPTHTSNFGFKLDEKCGNVGASCSFVHKDSVRPEFVDSTDYLIHRLRNFSSNNKVTENFDTVTAQDISPDSPYTDINGRTFKGYTATVPDPTTSVKPGEDGYVSTTYQTQVVNSGNAGYVSMQAEDLTQGNIGFDASGNPVDGSNNPLKVSNIIMQLASSVNVANVKVDISKTGDNGAWWWHRVQCTTDGSTWKSISELSSVYKSKTANIDQRVDFDGVTALRFLVWRNGGSDIGEISIDNIEITEQATLVAPQVVPIEGMPNDTNTLEIFESR